MNKKKIIIFLVCIIVVSIVIYKILQNMYFIGEAKGEKTPYVLKMNCEYSIDNVVETERVTEEKNFYVYSGTEFFTYDFRKKAENEENNEKNDLLTIINIDEKNIELNHNGNRIFLKYNEEYTFIVKSNQHMRISPSPPSKRYTIKFQKIKNGE